MVVIDGKLSGLAAVLDPDITVEQATRIKLRQIGVKGEVPAMPQCHPSMKSVHACPDSFLKSTPLSVQTT